jgi:hypothetical protein
MLSLLLKNQVQTRVPKCHKISLSKNLPFFVPIKGHNSEVSEAIWLVIELGRNIMPINIFPMFHLNNSTTVGVIERTSLRMLPARRGCYHNTTRL